ncbi:MAG: AbgT family transporter [Phycisphaerales bacterium]
MSETPPRPDGDPADGPETSPTDRPTSGWFARFLGAVEWLGNLLPHPVTLFALFALGIVVVSAVAGHLEVSAADPRPEGFPGRADNGLIEARSLLSGEGIRWMATNLVTNFTGFVPLGTVLVALLGVGVAEKSGLLSAVIRGMILSAPKSLVTLVIVFASVVSNTASEMGYVVIIPMAAAIFHALGRHPIAGLAAAFAGVSGGYSANILLGTVDPLLAGITQEAARFVDPTYEVHAAVNYYFMAVSTVFITVVGTLVTTRIVEPRLGKWDAGGADESLDKNPSMDPLSSGERRGLRWAGLACLACVLLFAHVGGLRFGESAVVPTGTTLAEFGTLDDAGQAALVESATALEQSATVTLHRPATEGWRATVDGILTAIPAHGVLRDPDTGGVMPSPFLRSVVAMILVFFVLPGFVYGRIVGTLRTDRDVIDAMAEAMSSMGLYIVLVFFAAQFVAYFRWSNLGGIVAVYGADLLIKMNLDNPLVFIPFILMCCFVNLMLGSASAQWAVTAPIFVPMLMKLGYSPEVIQAAYRIGDSTTNTITPMMSYFGLILAFAAKYDKRLGIGTLVSTMLPYSIVFLLGWIALFYIWVFGFKLPVGPGAETYYQPTAIVAPADGAP